MSLQAPDRWLFDAWSRGYDFEIAQRLAYRPVHDAVLQLLAHIPGRRVLDVDCGTGELARRLRQSFASMRVVGCDFSAGMLRQASTKGAAFTGYAATPARDPLPRPTLLAGADQRRAAIRYLSRGHVPGVHRRKLAPTEFWGIHIAAAENLKRVFSVRGGCTRLPRQLSPRA